MNGSPPRGRAGATGAIARWLAGGTWLDAPADVVERATGCIVDTIGVALAGAATDVARRARVAVGTADGHDEASAIGVGRKMSTPRAALLNGVAAHALDFDDNSYSLQGHPSAVVLPAALAAVEARDGDGRALVGAFIAGVEVACKLGAALNPQHFRKGWHATASIGVFGAAAAGSAALHADEEAARHALGYAAAMASGLRASLGTMAKPWHVGRAAESGLVAARLAAAGLTASAEAIEAPDGFAAVYNDGILDPAPLEALGAPFDLVRPGVMVKRYPSCSATAAALDAVFDLVGEQPIAWREVSSVECELTPLAFRSLPHARPRGPLEAKFSLPFCVAVALVRGRVDLDAFSERTLADPEIQEAMRRVTVRVDDRGSFSPADGPEAATVTLRMRDGTTARARCAHPRGTPEAPLRPGELRDKFLACAEDALGADAPKAYDLIANVARLEDLAELGRLLRGATEGRRRLTAATQRDLR